MIKLESFDLPRDPHEERKTPQTEESVPEFDESKINLGRLRDAIKKAREDAEKDDEADTSDAR